MLKQKNFEQKARQKKVKEIWTKTPANNIGL